MGCASDRPATAEDAARIIARDLGHRGHVAYFAGGCVRDRLLGNLPKDFDVATDAHPDVVRKLFRRTHEVGAMFGVILVHVQGQTVEVSTFRADGRYSDARHPDNVEFADPKRDAKRRDFTINGLFEDPESGEIIDFVGGRQDLAEGLIRAIGNPAERFAEDHLRMIRAVRFAGRLGFSIEPRTAGAIEHAKAELLGISRERIGQEVRLMLEGPGRMRCAELLQRFGLDAFVLREAPFEAPLIHLDGVHEDAGFEVALAAWLLDRHCGRHCGAVGLVRDRPALIARWARALVLSNDERRAVGSLLKLHEALLKPWADRSVAERKRLASSAHFKPAFALAAADDAIAVEAIQRDVAELQKSGLAPTPLINGTDLIELGLTPGPVFRDILEAVYDAQLEQRVMTKDQAIAMARDAAT